MVAVSLARHKSAAPFAGKMHVRVRHVHVRPVLACASLTTAILLWAAAGRAPALIVHLPGRTVSYSPVGGVPAKTDNAQGGGRPLEYHGGPVMTSNTSFAVYWDPSGAPAYPAGYEAGINRYFEDLAHDSGGDLNTDSVLAQYTNSLGEPAAYDSHFGGALVDNDPYPANGCSAAPTCLTDEQLRAELKAYVEANRLPTDLVHEYLLLTPPGVESCLEAAGRSCSAGSSHPVYCSYHSFISVAGGVLVYANTPYLEGTNCDTGEEHPNGNPSDATLGGGLVHEHSESVTDPELNAWYDSKGEEVADKCRTLRVATEFGEPLGKAPDGSNYNQVIDSDLYWYQQEWSNQAGTCEQRAAVGPTVRKVAPKRGPATGGTSVTITGTGFEAPATVHFGANLASEVHVNSSSSITAVVPPGAVGTVNVTVTTPAGTSPIAKKARFKYKKPKRH